MDNFELAKQSFLQGLEALQMKAMSQAEAHFRRSLEWMPGRLSTLVNLAAALLAQHKFAELKRTAQAIVDADEIGRAHV